MLTQCPGCQTVFRITGTILRAAHGQVRCGRCNTQFDANQNVFDHEDLIQDDPVADQSPVEKTEYLPSRDAAASEATAFMSSSFDNNVAQHEPQHEQVTIEENGFDMNNAVSEDREFMVDNDTPDDSIIEIFNIDSEEWRKPFPPANASVDDDAQAESVELENAVNSYANELTRVREQLFGEEAEEQPLFIQQSDEEININEEDNNAATFNEAIYMSQLENALEEDQDIAQPDYLLDAEPEEYAEQSPAPDPEPAIEKTKLRHWATSRKSRSQPPPDVLEPDLYEEQSSSRWPLALACIGLSLLLAIQVIHHYRQTLVRHPGFGPVLKSFYSMLGQNLEPRWDVNAYSIKQWGIVSDPQEPGVLRVRASITNNALFAQPYPLLKLTLEDRFGTRLGTRAFKPGEYLPSVTSATHLLESGMAANVDLAIVDPGAEAVGFQFDSCLGDVRTMHCAHD